MNTKCLNLLRKFMLGCANLALAMAVVSVGNTCCFLSYQPDAPEELMQK